MSSKRFRTYPPSSFPSIGSSPWGRTSSIVWSGRGWSDRRGPARGSEDPPSLGLQVASRYSGSHDDHPDREQGEVSQIRPIDRTEDHDSAADKCRERDRVDTRYRLHSRWDIRLREERAAP